jgi:hypothetical protein
MRLNEDHFQLIEGKAPIVIGAPHHGTLPNVSADKGTGPIAFSLADQLQARAVIVHNLRHRVDVNKNPWSIQEKVRHFALEYQNGIFWFFPSLIIEVHGHASGKYDIELTTGFDLDPEMPEEAAYLDRLEKLKQDLSVELKKRAGQRITIGAFPLDRDVTKTATATFTFQKIRRARNLAGMNWYGLHVEINPELRANLKAREALSMAFARSIRESFFPLPASEDRISTLSAHLGINWSILNSRSLVVCSAPHKFISRNVVVVNPEEMQRLAVQEEDGVLLSNQNERLRSAILSSSAVRKGMIALPARVRHQISAELGVGIVVSHITKEHTTGRENRSTGEKNVDVPNNVVIARMRPERSNAIWLPPSMLQKLNLISGMRVSLHGQSQAPGLESLPVQVDAGLGEGLAALPEHWLEQMGLTLGEVISIQKE